MLDGDTPTVQPGNGLGFEHVEAFVGGAITANERGLRFERACAYLLRHAPEYGLADVWLWREWPDRDASGFGLQDLGIDLVGRTRSGELWAIQAKFRTDPAQMLTWEELATFVGHSARPDLFAYRLVITNTWAVPARFEKATTGQAIGWLGRADLLALGLDWRPLLEPATKPVSSRKSPRPHQEVAVRDVVTHLADHDRTQLIMACGTGKTLTTLWIAEARSDQRVLVLVPSLSLLRQFRREWLESADPALPFADLCVCSDVTVAGGHARGMADDLQERAADLGVPVTTDAQTIAIFLRGDGRRVVFATYQSSPRIADAMTDPAVPLFDLAIADEAHRLAAPTDRAFATVLDGSKIRARRRLFATATPRYLAPQVKRRAEEEDVEVVSMDDPETFGVVAHQLSFGQAIAQDLLSDYRVVVLTTKDVETADLIESRRLVRPGDDAPVTDAATFATLTSVTRAVAELGLRRLISFHRTVERARSFARAATRTVITTAGSSDHRLEASFVSGEMTAGERAEKLDRLRSADGQAVLLANARCLTEGVDVPALDGVVFVDPRWSPIDIVQAVGRVIRKAEAKNLGTIVIPVLVPDDADPDAVLEDSSFEIVWSVVRALRSHDERLAEVLSTARTELGRNRKPGGSAFLDAHFGVLDLPAAFDPAAFAAAIELRIVREGSFSFDEGLGHLLAYVEEHGDTRVPVGYRAPDGTDLGRWVISRRSDHLRGSLPAGRVAALGTVPGWTWDPYEDDFRAGLTALRTYVAARGGARMPPTYRAPDGFRLGAWVVARRAEHRRGQLPSDRVAELEAVPGWSWDPFKDDFEAGLAALRGFVAEHGHARVPVGYVAADGFRLGAWGVARRAEQRAGRLPRDRVAALESVPGWSWEPLRDDSQAALAALHAFVAEHGHARVPINYQTPDGFGLGRWVDHQRVLRRAAEIGLMQLSEVESLPGWTWDPYEDDFRAGLTALRTYVAARGGARMPPTYRAPDGFRLGAWVVARRAEHRRGQLPSDRVAELEAVPGWSWDPFKDDFEAGLAALRGFVAEHGHARVPVGYVAADGFRLGAWVDNRRTEWKRGRLSQERVVPLESLTGWTWQVRRRQ